MSTHPRNLKVAKSHATSAAIFSLSLACSGSPESSSLGEGSTITMDPILGCRGMEHLLPSLEFETELGFSADEAITSSDGIFASRFRWLPPTGPIVYSPGGSDSTLSVDLVNQSPAARFVRALDCPPSSSCSPSCVSQVYLDMDLRLNTADGVFAEEWPVQLGFRDVGLGFAQTTVLPDSFTGDLMGEDFWIAPGWTANAYKIELELANGSSRGSFQVEAEADDGSVFDGVLGLWPPPN